MAATGGAKGVLAPHGITARLAKAVFLSACTPLEQVIVKRHLEMIKAGFGSSICWQCKQVAIPVKSRLRLGAVT